MTFVHRVLDPEPVGSLDEWVATGGGRALEAARAAEPGAVIETLVDSGLRGRGGAGFPTGVKWRSVAAMLSDELPATVVVNGAEGEPGSYKDRAILLANPYRVLEGALIAASSIGADEVVVALKGSVDAERADGGAGREVVDRVRRAVEEISVAGWLEGTAVDVVEGPGHYLYGEETALLEVINGREPFPRIAPPWRRGAEDVGDEVALSGEIDLATADQGTPTPPALVDNVETLANVPAIVLDGPREFRAVGSDESPGTLVVTVSGRSLRHAVAEVAMGTTLREVIDEVGGGAQDGAVTAVLCGVSGPVVPASLLDTPLTHEDMAAAGLALGAGAYLVLDETSDPVAVAQGVSRFLAVESCGQCTPCKQDGVQVSITLERLRASTAEVDELDDLHRRLDTITGGARCALATQHQVVVGSLLAAFPDAVEAHTDGRAAAVEPVLVAEIVALEGERFRLDEAHAAKQPDWTFGDEDSGTAPAELRNQQAR